jgi:hypothetical protein
MTTDAQVPAQAIRPHANISTPMNTTMFISVAEVMLRTAAIPSTSIRTVDALRKACAALLRARTPRRTCPPRRSDYLERAAMAREMDRL